MAHAEKELTKGSQDYLPVTDQATDQLIGIISASDILRARSRAREILRPEEGRSLLERLEQERA